MLVEQDVVGLDVAVDHALAVREADCARDVDPHADEHVLGEHVHHFQAVGQPLGEVVHGEVDGIAVLSDREDLDDVGMPKPGCRGGLAPEALLEFLVARVLGLENLERHRNFELGVERLVDPGEPPGPDDGVNPELAE